MECPSGRRDAIAPGARTACAISSLAYNADGEFLLASANKDGTVGLWNPATGHQLHPQRSPRRGRKRCVQPQWECACFAGADGSVIVWNVATGKRELTVNVGHGNLLYGVQFSPNGRTFAAGSSSGDVYIWDATTGALVYDLQGHFAPIYAVAFSPDGTMLAEASGDGSVLIWDPRDGSSAVRWSDMPRRSRTSRSVPTERSLPLRVPMTRSCCGTAQDRRAAGRSPAPPGAGQRRRVQPARSDAGLSQRRPDRSRLGPPHDATGPADHGTRRRGDERGLQPLRPDTRLGPRLVGPISLSPAVPAVGNPETSYARLCLCRLAQPHPFGMG